MLGVSSIVSHCLATSTYANSACLRFLKANDITTVTVPTGVKNARGVASKYVIGLTSEYNGHCTVQVQWDWLEKALKGKEDRPQAVALKALLRIANPLASDSIANLLLMEALMSYKDYSLQMLHNLYAEMPSTMVKLEVANKHKFRTSWDESRLIDPQRLADVIAVFSTDKEGGRVVVRPSGTEQCLRVYVETKK